MLSLSPSIRAGIAPLVLILLLFYSAVAQLPLAYSAEALVDINTASPAVLAERLPGIGPAKAKAIVSHREQHGPFKTLDELMNVKGIGPGILKKIRPLIFIDQVAAEQIEQNVAPKTASSQVQKEHATRRAVRAAVSIAKQYVTN